MRTILLVAPTANVRASLERMLGRAGWTVTTVRTWADATPVLKDAAVVISERDLPDGSWMSVLNGGHGPPVIVTAARADAKLWAEVIQSGGHDVLAQPLDENEAVYAVRAAAGALPRNKQPLAMHTRVRSL